VTAWYIGFMLTLPTPPAAFTGPGLLLRLANGPVGRALLGVTLGLLLFAAQNAGWFRQADYQALDAANALAHRLWESAPIVLTAAPGGEAGANLRAAALQAVLSSGAAAVGLDETFVALQPGEPSEAARRLQALATDPRCVVARTGPIGPGDFVPSLPKPTVVESFVYESGRARRVLPRAGVPDGFVREVTVRALAGARRPRGVQAALGALEGPRAMLIDYSLRPRPVELTTLEALASASPPTLQERIRGRVVLLSSAHWQHTSPPGRGAVTTPSGLEPALPWAIATALAGSGSREPAPELLGSGLVLLSLLLMLTMGDRGLGGKLRAGGVALAAVAGLVLGCLAWWRVFVPPCAAITGATLAFLLAVCLELAEAGQVIAHEATARPEQPPWGSAQAAASPAAAVEDALRSILKWHGLPGAALLLRDQGAPTGLVTVAEDGAADWTGSRELQALGDTALLSGTPAIGDWPAGGKAAALPVVLGPGRGAALILHVGSLPVPRAVAEFGTQTVRQLLATRAPSTALSPTVLNAARRPHRLALPAQVARLRAAQAARQEQIAVAAAWRAGPHEAVIVFDTAGRPVVWNRRAERLFNKAAGKGSTQAHLVPLLAEMLEAGEEEVREAAMGVLLDGTPYLCDLEDSGRGHNYVASLTRLGADPAAPAGLALRCIDVTGVCRPARVEARLMSIAAHEMRTPLTSVLGYAELLEDQTEEGSKARRYAQAIHRQAERMEAVVAELLTVTRLEAGREELVVEPVDLALVAQQVAAGLLPVAEARQIGLTVDAREESQVRGDVPKLERVLENLVTNAIKYSPEGAAVSVQLHREGDRVVLAVRDTGYGIPAEDAPHVFEKFYRARNQRTESVQGTGLGLAIVRLIVEAHGGSVSLRTVEGEGSTFTVVLPVNGPPEREASEPAA